MSDDQSVPILCQWLEYIEAIFNNLTVGDVLDILIELGHQNSRYRAAGGNLYELCELYTIPECLDDEARHYEVEFLGGPPTSDWEAGWYRGTLVTWAVDAILYDFATNEGSIAMGILSDMDEFQEDQQEQEEEDLWDEDGADDEDYAWRMSAEYAELSES